MINPLIAHPHPLGVDIIDPEDRPDAVIGEAMPGRVRGDSPIIMRRPVGRVGHGAKAPVVAGAASDPTHPEVNTIHDLVPPVDADVDKAHLPALEGHPKRKAAGDRLSDDWSAQTIIVGEQLVLGEPLQLVGANPQRNRLRVLVRLYTGDGASVTCTVVVGPTKASVSGADLAGNLFGVGGGFVLSSNNDGPDTIELETSGAIWAALVYQDVPGSSCLSVAQFYNYDK